MPDTQPFLRPRSVPLERGFNLRDFGGYETTDGRHVRRDVLFRSGTMALLTDADAVRLRALGIRAICDFRRQNERAAEPTAWHGPEVDYYSRDYGESSGILGALLREGASAQDMRAVMIALYRELPSVHAASYRAMFERLLAGQVPLLINCSAGKDRTGVGAALILLTLGVPWDRVQEDYLLTNDHADWALMMEGRNNRLARAWRETPDVIRPVLAVDADYLAALRSALDAEHGGLDSYLASIEVDAPAQERLREILLEP